MAVSPPTSSSSAKDPPPSPNTKTAETSFLSTVEGEVAFFRSIMRARPVGLHRHFHLLSMQNAIFKDTGRLLHAESLWDKLKGCYDLDALDAIELEADGYRQSTDAASPVLVRSPSPNENLVQHPFFKDEFSLPWDEAFESIMSQRRMRATASAPSSPITSPAPPVSASATSTKQSRRGATASTNAASGRRRAKSKADLAGLVGGDSDSSALTQESGDEAGVGTSRESVVTGTDGGTDFGEDEDAEMKEQQPSPAARSASPKPQRGRPKGSKKGRGRPPATPSATTRSTKKRKR